MEQTFEIKSAVVSDRGLSEKRPQNEDSYLNLPDLGVFAVADGVGGAQAGDVASQMAMEILAEAFANANGGDPEATMRAALERANLAIYQMANDLPQLSSMATTVVAVHLRGDTATIAHVGDSRAYRVTPAGGLERETNDHSVVEEEVRAGRMTIEEAAVHPGRNVISRALGAEETVDIDLKKLIIEPGTGFLLCSDGITRHIDDGELLGILSAGLEPQETCLRLKELCFERGAEDNLTAVVVSVPRDAEFAALSPQADAAEASPNFDDTEEVTISTARSPFDSTVTETEEEKPQFDEYIEEFQDTEEIRDEDDSFMMVEDESHIEVEEPEAESASPIASEPPAAPAAPTSVAAAPAFSAYDAQIERSAGSSGTRIIYSLALLALGALAGVGGYYLYQKSQPPTPATVVEQPVITEMKSTKPALIAFEEGRRQVDADPAKYANANAASPQNAEDYFLLGRAFLLTGKYWEAKRAFNEAKSRLKPEDENSKTLASEIAMALVIIENPKATEMFQRDVVSQSQPSNTNTAPAPLR
jgi:protein phosphatase